jgi:hypothetical protein
MIGFANAGFIVANPATMVSLGKLSAPTLTFIAGLIITVILLIRNVKGSILIGIVLTSLLAWPIGRWWGGSVPVITIENIIASPDFSLLFELDLINSLMDQEIDLAIADRVPNPETAGFGHAFGFPAERLFGDREIPMIPILLNTYFPPNVMTPKRCWDVGSRLRRAIEASPLDLRVAVLASGGLSHFVVEEEFDRAVMKGLAEPDGERLRNLPRCALLEGTSEVLNWIMTAGAVAPMPLAWSEYEAIRRTPAGTGIGCGFAVWKPA